ncbi:hypothetical protein MIR68_011682 [Amoeboaphelidium protococcarum]|nr:hypothetical protein MIR68_011682 [Amoeboaphelidium protococcarum]
MDFLKSTFNKVYGVATFPYSIESAVSEPGESVWTVLNGTKKDDGQKVLIFKARSDQVMAQNSARKMKSIRHPLTLKIIDSIQTDDTLYVMTERAQPLTGILKTKASSLHQDLLIWGLYNVSQFLIFLHNETQSIHCNIRPSSIFVTPSGEWKVAGFELLSSVKNDTDYLWTQYSQYDLLPGVKQYLPQEILQNNQSAFQSIKNCQSPLHSVDSFMLACLCWVIFNHSEYNFTTSQSIAEEIRGRGRMKVPADIWAFMQKCLHSDPLVRPNLKGFVSNSAIVNIAAQDGGDGSELLAQYFQSNPYIQVSRFLDNVTIASPKQKKMFSKQLTALVENKQISDDFIKTKVNDALCNAVEFGSLDSSYIVLILNTVLKDQVTFRTKMQDSIARLYASNDRQLRLALLESLHLYIGKLDKSVINDKIFPNLVNGFNDQIPVVREASLKSLVVIVEYLSERSINTELVQCLEKCQMDQEAAIRANTVICLGKICKFMSEQTRKKLLIQSFCRSLKDPFVPARTAALSALTATAEYYTAADQASKIMPVVVPLLVDSAKSVRDASFKLIRVYLGKLEQHAEQMPSQQPEQERTESVRQQPQSLQQQQQQQQQQQVMNGEASKSQAQSQSLGFGSMISPSQLTKYSHDTLGNSKTELKVNVAPDVDSDDWGDLDSFNQKSVSSQDSSMVLKLPGMQKSGMQLGGSGGAQQLTSQVFSELSLDSQFNGNASQQQQSQQQQQQVQKDISGFYQQPNSDLEKKREEHRARIEALKQQRRQNKLANALDDNSQSLI